jgi:hypothetical protein
MLVIFGLNVIGGIYTRCEIKHMAKPCKKETEMKNSIRAWLLIGCLLFIGTSVFAQASGRANFGNYPADYPLAYASMVGFSKSPTIRSLFGPNAHFITSFQGIPAIVTLESTNGTKGKFTVQLLLTVKVPEKGDMKVVRLQVTFESDAMSEMSYIRYVKMVNMINGQASEQISYGDQMSDGNIMGFFLGTMELFWDVSKYQ